MQKHDNSTFENEATKAEAARVKAELDAGGDPFGDNDVVQEPVTEVVETASDPQNEPPIEAAQQDPQTAEAQHQQTQAQVDDVSPDLLRPAPQIPPLQDVDVNALNEQKKALASTEEQIETKWSKGELNDEGRAAQLAQVREQRDSIIEQIAQAKAVAAVSEQMRFQSDMQVINNIAMRSAQAKEIDYSKAAARGAFNGELEDLRRQYPQASFSAIAEQAHKNVMATFGVTNKAEPAKPPARTAPAAPLTLGRIPAASTANTNGGQYEQLSRKHGLDFQQAIGSMKKEQRDAWLDS